MRNILKMNLFRMARTRTTYILAGVAVALQLLLFFITYLTESAIEGMYTAEFEIEIAHSAFEAFLMQGTLPGSTLISLLFVMMFFSSEISTGYIKNLVGYEGNKFALAGANLITTVLYSLFVTILNVGVSILFSVIFFKSVTFEGLGNFLGYLGVTYLETVAFITLILAWSDRKGKHVLRMILGVVYLIYAMLIYQLINLAVDWIWEKQISIGKYTLLGGMSTLNLESEPKAFFLLGGIALAVLVLAFFLDVIALKKRELK